MAKKSNLWAKIGVWSYVVGLVVAIIVGILAQFGGASSMTGGTVALLAILGTVVGLLNIGDEEVNTFLLAAVAFVVASSAMASIFSVMGDLFKGLALFMSAIVVFTAPGALIVAFKALYNVAKNG
ncbi:hypothetical protein JXA12_04150 [Candidatus Woesearchaeota archaeon]|nr:hypothetical protein [Candidatus Woesearchaeota archaeon]